MLWLKLALYLPHTVVNTAKITTSLYSLLVFPLSKWEVPVLLKINRRVGCPVGQRRKYILKIYILNFMYRSVHLCTWQFAVDF